MNFIEILKAVFLGIVEGITEWLPISSTGHMILVDEFLKMNVRREFWNMFLVVIQLGAILAVVVLYWDKLFPFSFKKGENFIKKDIFNLWFKIIFAAIPAAVIGIPLNDMVEEKFSNYIVVAIALIVYGVIFILIENWNHKKHFAINDISKLSYKTAFCIGLFQVLSLIPGTSRSGSTIIGGMLMGTSRVVAAEFTFYLAIPVMFGASLLRLLKFGLVFTGMEVAILLTGMVAAFIVSIISIKFLMSYIKKYDFKAFGYYRIILGILVLAYFILTGR
ncbi:undecaprenyl-diphosphate phosphatase [Sinanaerobacter sp. ZZT-01]|uniref:undecaprenyl-diphosphate phosphatase n=1 Tax=Sinanaerobacter sp. ZZT-01 TaxID=3111540 RepID=UPI002D7845A9|nr:undecaprenyl-diphosphate phosphatase [Sinanaerobacter sp. ZZT-01]WRR92129.1 undecaprenyl-diphosphate phosphatase [Sinanaerobacter sp. ZZT-01]